MASKGSMVGWIFFAGLMMLLIGVLNAIQGVIAIFEDEYFVPTQSGYVVLDLTGWGWTLLIWGAILALGGLGLLAGQSWARWFGIIVVALNVIAQLGFVGGSDYPLWSLAVLALNIVVLYALCVRWNDSQEAAAGY